MSQQELFQSPRLNQTNETAGGGCEPSGFYLDGAESLPPKLAKLFTHSSNQPQPFDKKEMGAFYAVLYARMSELPLMREIERFSEKVSGAGNKAEAERKANDRGDSDVRTVRMAARKVQVEIQRMMGFLRFSPDAEGVYIARCEPLYFVLPALAEHFTLRFGETPWAIIDEKRNLCLFREKNGDVYLKPEKSAEKSQNVDGWGDLWRLYQRSITNESRINPNLQRQFMPKRYHKHLNEL